MESTLLNKQVKNLEHELHQMNIYLRDIGESLRILSNRDTNTREELSDDDLK